MDTLKEIQHILIEKVYSQLDNLDEVSTLELGEAIDMIKDLSESMYYCTIVKAMNEESSLG